VQWNKANPHSFYITFNWCTVFPDIYDQDDNWLLDTEAFHGTTDMWRNQQNATHTPVKVSLKTTKSYQIMKCSSKVWSPVSIQKFSRFNKIVNANLVTSWGAVIGCTHQHWFYHTRNNFPTCSLTLHCSSLRYSVYYSLTTL